MNGPHAHCVRLRRDPAARDQPSAVLRPSAWCSLPREGEHSAPRAAGRALPRRNLMGKRVVIVGGGVIGLCAAYYCARRGWRVTLVERNAERRDGCSFGNAGMLVHEPLRAARRARHGGARAQVDVESGVAVLREAAPVAGPPRLGLPLLARGHAGARAPRGAAAARPERGEPSVLRRAGRASGQRFRPRAQGAADAVPHTPRARRGRRHRRNGSRAGNRFGGARCRARSRRSIPASGWTSPAPSIFRRIVT